MVPMGTRSSSRARKTLEVPLKYCGSACPGADELALEREDAQEIDEVCADEAQRAQVGQLRRGETQRAQGIELALHLRQQRAQVEALAVAAHEAVLGLRARVPMQHRLPHRELVEVGLQEAVDDGGHQALRRWASSAGAASGTPRPRRWRYRPCSDFT
jgi:hypothetical protein